MIQDITQQRKQRKILIGTTQRFERIAKPLREQVNYIYYPVTLFGCITIVKVCKPKVDDEGKLTKERVVKRYFFIHSDELRKWHDKGMPELCFNCLDEMATVPEEAQKRFKCPDCNSNHLGLIERNGNCVCYDCG